MQNKHGREKSLLKLVSTDSLTETSTPTVPWSFSSNSRVNRGSFWDERSQTMKIHWVHIIHGRLLIQVIFTLNDVVFVTWYCRWIERVICITYWIFGFNFVMIHFGIYSNLRMILMSKSMKELVRMIQRTLKQGLAYSRLNLLLKWTVSTKSEWSQGWRN